MMLCNLQNSIKKYKQLGRFDDLKHPGRPEKLPDPEIRHLKRLGKGNFRLSTNKIANELERQFTRTGYNKNSTKIFERSCSSICGKNKNQ